eukprot:scaffold108449_cov20-Prasinocladus_malaysianus.AAC.1
MAIDDEKNSSIIAVGVLPTMIVTLLVIFVHNSILYLSLLWDGMLHGCTHIRLGNAAPDGGMKL